LEGSAKNASRDARGEADNIVVSSKLNSWNPPHSTQILFKNPLPFCCKPFPIRSMT
jgi:hypothetical protein